MNKDQVFSFYEKVYFDELGEMNQILSRFPILIAGTGLIINAYIFLFKFDNFLALNNIAIYVFTGSIALAISVLLFCLYRTFRPLTYQKVSPLEMLEVKRKEYKDYETGIKIRNLNADDDCQQRETSADDLFRSDIQNKFIICSTANCKSNDKRREWFHKSLFLIWINLVLCITIPVSTIAITHWNTNMSEEKKNPPPVPKPAETETQSMRNVIPLNENYRRNDSAPPPKEKKDNK